MGAREYQFDMMRDKYLDGAVDTDKHARKTGNNSPPSDVEAMVRTATSRREHERCGYPVIELESRKDEAKII